MLMRMFFMFSMVSAVGIFSGCCAGPCGPIDCADNCYDCGDTYGNGGMVYGPIQSLHRMRKSLVCGSGCGEVYRGEWRSTPPDACDPCQDGQFVGGAAPCVPFCWRPGFLLELIPGLYGQRFCDGCGNDFNACGCGPGMSYTASRINADVPCESCNSGQAHSHHTHSNRIAYPETIQTDHRTARGNAIRRGVSSSYSKSPTRYR